MPPKLKILSGREVITIMAKFSFTIHSQRGSHVKLRRMGAGGEKPTITIPAHEELDRGTLRAIFRQASRYIPEEKLRPYFYSE